MKLCVLALATILVGCPQPPVTPPTPEGDAAAPDVTPEQIDDAPRTLASKACSALRKLHCPEADQPKGGQTCTEVMQHAIDTNITFVNESCIAKATTTKEVRACGSYAPCPGQP